jgi:uroporphyrinogen-III decarboxylase
MTRRERIIAALEGRNPDRIPRVYTPVPGWLQSFPGAMERLEARYPQDVVPNGYRLPEGATKGDPYAVGEYVDEWGCVFTNVHAGIIGEVKEPVIRSYSDLDSFRPPMHLVDLNFDEIAATCAATDGFTMSGLPLQPFERMQFLRGTENLFLDLAMQPAEVVRLRDLVHEFNLAYLEAWCRTPCDCVFIADDWGTQQTTLIAPDMWRELFKPLYRDYIRTAKQAGKFVYMHSDGMIIELIEDLIELGLDALNAQVTCMDMDELHRRYAGRITFWGQMDRQHMLCFGTVDDAIHEVREFHDKLRGPGGGHVVAQMHIEPSAKPENVEAVLAEFERLS